MSTISEQLGKQLIKEAWGTWDTIDTGLSMAGMIPGIGTLSNGISAVGNLAQGRFADAGLSTLGMIPGLGVVKGMGTGAKAVGLGGHLAKAFPTALRAARMPNNVMAGIKGMNHLAPIGTAMNGWGGMIARQFVPNSPTPQIYHPSTNFMPPTPTPTSMPPAQYAQAYRPQARSNFIYGNA